MPANFDRARAVIHFDVHFEDYNYDEDVENAATDSEARERLADFMRQGNDPTDACLNVESMAVREFAKELVEAIPSLKPAFGEFQITRWSHDEHGNLDCSFGVETVEQVKAVFDFIGREHGGGDDIIFKGFYTELRYFVFFPEGINGPRYGAGGGIANLPCIDEFFEPEEE